MGWRIATVCTLAVGRWRAAVYISNAKELARRIDGAYFRPCSMLYLLVLVAMVLDLVCGVDNCERARMCHARGIIGSQILQFMSGSGRGGRINSCASQRSGTRPGVHGHVATRSWSDF